MFPNRFLKPAAIRRTIIRSETGGASKFPKPLRTAQKGIDILHDPLWNKGMGFPFAERDRLGLRGLLPPIVKTMEAQLDRAMRHIESQPTNILKNLYLQDLHNRNETLFHRILVDNLEMVAPLVYTPTVGDVCMQFGSRYIRSRGMYFSAKERGLFSSMIWNWPHNDVQIIVVTDGSRILGLGDLGANGMGIPIGKLALYCAAGGIAPHRVLPVMLDVGTNNQSLLDDPDYIGLREKRLEGPEYVDLVDEFIHAAFQRWPGVVVQFEDFETKKAVPMLERYRDRFRVFNDDIQGTGSVTLSCLMSAARNANSTITQQRILCAGAGSAGLGVCSQLVKGMVNAGMTREDAMAQFCIVDMHGVLGKKDGALRDPHYNGKSAMNRDQMEWVNDNISDGSSLLQAIEEFKPTVLLGLSTVPKLFNEEVIKTMHKYCPTPIIMPMSNPTSRCECTAEEAYMWTNGQAVVASGSPFPAYTHSEGRTLVPSQCNNMYIFPGLGLGASLAGVTSITDTLLYVAAKACTDAMTDEEIGWGRTFPCLSRIRSVSHQIAVAVIKQAQRENLTTKITERDLKKDGSLEAYVSRKMYFPAYVPLVDPRG